MLELVTYHPSGYTSRLRVGQYWTCDDSPGYPKIEFLAIEICGNRDGDEQGAYLTRDDVVKVRQVLDEYLERHKNDADVTTEPRTPQQNERKQ